MSDKNRITVTDEEFEVYERISGTKVKKDGIIYKIYAGTIDGYILEEYNPNSIRKIVKEWIMEG